MSDPDLRAWFGTLMQDADPHDFIDAYDALDAEDRAKLLEAIE